MNKFLTFLFIERTLYSIRDHGDLRALWGYVDMKGVPQREVERVIYPNLKKLKKFGIWVRQAPLKDQAGWIDWYARKIAGEIKKEEKSEAKKTATGCH